VLNLAVAVASTVFLRAPKVSEGVERTSPADYTADEGDKDLPELTADPDIPADPGYVV
jgi:solute:Na+ symporter, SSS family